MGRVPEGKKVGCLVMKEAAGGNGTGWRGRTPKLQAIKGKTKKAALGFEPRNKGFAVPRLILLATPPLVFAGNVLIEYNRPRRLSTKKGGQR